MGLQALWNFGPAQAGLLLPIGTGVSVGGLILLGALYFSRRNQVSFLDVLLLRRPRQQTQAAAVEDVPEGVVTPEALAYLKTPEEDLTYLQTQSERRKSVRQWGNPVEVRLLTPSRVFPLRGVVINRSPGGLAILVDDAQIEGAPLKVRGVQAPESVAWIGIEVRNCRAVGKNWVIGCKYSEEPPWKAVAWLG
jgi:hypothetical protein